ncbi:MAG: folP [Rhizobium sp.]|nr:folP [Rhizobium sp.]
MPSPFDPVDWKLAHGRTLCLGPEGLIMAIINVTPDSFSDGGVNASTDTAIGNALRAVKAGAVIIDVGGESTRPGAAEVSAAEEQARVLPVIEGLAAHCEAIISIDTYRADTARKAIAAGAHVINDVHGLQREPAIAGVAAETGAGLVIMHTGRGRETLDDPIEDQLLFLGESLDIATAAGVARQQIVLDPGFGFGKETAHDNLALMARFPELHALGYPLLAGTSRKRFLGTVTGRDPADRGAATAASSALLRMAGAAIFRVHDVAFNSDAIKVTDAMLSASDRGKERHQ